MLPFKWVILRVCEPSLAWGGGGEGERERERERGGGGGGDGTLKCHNKQATLACKSSNNMRMICEMIEPKFNEGIALNYEFHYAY